jgi:hypothetical protein
MLQPSVSDAALLGLSQELLPSSSASSAASKSEESGAVLVVTLWVWRSNAHMALQRLCDGLAVTASSIIITSSSSQATQPPPPAVTLPASVTDAERAIASLWPGAAPPEDITAQLQAGSSAGSAGTAVTTRTGPRTGARLPEQGLSLQSDPVDGCLLTSTSGGITTSTAGVVTASPSGATAATAVGSHPTPKLVRSPSAGLLQATCLLILPTQQQGAAGSAGGTPRSQQQPVVGLDWGMVSEVLGAVRADGFSLAGMTAFR